MLLLDGAHHLEQGGDAVEALLTSGLGHLLVHGGPLLVLAGGGRPQVFGGGADAAQLLEPHLGVLLLIVGGLLEDGGDLLIAVLLGLAGEVGVLVAGLALAGESGPQIGFGLASLEFHM